MSEERWIPRARFNREMALEEWLETFEPNVWDRQQEIVSERLEWGVDDFNTFAWLEDAYPELMLRFNLAWAKGRG